MRHGDRILSTKCDSGAGLVLNRTVGQDPSTKSDNGTGSLLLNQTMGQDP